MSDCYKLKNRKQEQSKTALCVSNEGQVSGSKDKTKPTGCVSRSKIDYHMGQRSYDDRGPRSSYDSTTEFDDSHEEFVSNEAETSFDFYKKFDSHEEFVSDSEHSFVSGFVEEKSSFDSEKEFDFHAKFVSNSGHSPSSLQDVKETFDSDEFENKLEHNPVSKVNDPVREFELNVDTSSNVCEEENPSDLTSNDDSGKIPDHFDSQEEFDTLHDPQMEVFLPFIHNGSVSLNSDLSNSVSVKILRDTGSAQTFISENTLNFSPESFQNSHVFINGMFSQETSSAPLHTVYLKSDIISGPITVGVAPVESFPFKGIDVIPGNDAAGKKVQPDLIVTETPMLEQDSDDQEIPGLYPSCAVLDLWQSKLHMKMKQKMTILIKLKLNLKIRICPQRRSCLLKSS